MQKYYKLLLSNFQDVKKIKTAVISLAALLIVLFIILLAISKHNNQSDAANITAYIPDPANATVTIRPDPMFNVKITADNKTFEVMSSGTVNDALDNADIEIGEDDLINIGLTEMLNENTEIVINRVTVMEEVLVETLDYATEYKEDNDLTVGCHEVLVDGEEGEIEKVIQHTYVDGELVESEVISEEITDPIDKVVLMGTKNNNYIAEMSISELEVPDYLVLDENGVPTSYSNVLTGKSCAYSAKKGAKTASGRTATVGCVAVDPSIIPYGTELYIAATDGSAVYGYAIAADTGTALLDGTILVDLFMESYNASCNWGARQVNIYILN